MTDMRRHESKAAVDRYVQGEAKDAEIAARDREEMAFWRKAAERGAKLEDRLTDEIVEQRETIAAKDAEIRELRARLDVVADLNLVRLPRDWGIQIGKAIAKNPLHNRTASVMDVVSSWSALPPQSTKAMLNELTRTAAEDGTADANGGFVDTRPQPECKETGESVQSPAEIASRPQSTDTEGESNG